MLVYRLGTIRRPTGRWRERSRKSDVSCEPSATATSTLGTSYGQAQIDSGPSTIRLSFLTNLVRRSGCPHGTSDCIYPVRSLLPDTLAPSSSRSRSTRSHINSNYPLNTGFIPPSTSHFSNHITLLFLHPQSLARSRNPLSR